MSALALWQAGSLKIGAIFVGASLAALLALWVLARGVIASARRFPRARGLAWRHGVAALARPGSHAPRVIVALGIAVMLLVTVALLQGVLGRQIDHERRQDTPSFFFLDIQPDQRESFTRIVEQAAGAPPALTPVVRARLAALDGERLTRAVVDSPAVARRRRRAALVLHPGIRADLERCAARAQRGYSGARGGKRAPEPRPRRPWKRPPPATSASASARG